MSAPLSRLPSVNIERWGTRGIIQIQGEGSFRMRRLEHEFQPSQWWWGKPRESELWALADGRRLELYRRGTKAWKFQWPLN